MKRATQLVSYDENMKPKTIRTLPDAAGKTFDEITKMVENLAQEDNAHFVELRLVWVRDDYQF